ncbi:MAG: Npt1/Npt2 family nucleotide transporter [Chromatiales bacterium]
MSTERRGVDLARLTRRDAQAMVFALFTATVMIAQQVAGKATRDALFLSQFDVRQLPKVVMLSAVLSIAGVLLMSRLLALYGPSRLVPRVFALSALLFVGEWWLFGREPHLTVILLYLHMGVFGALLISGFWSVINERFDPHAAKRRIVRIAAAATMGGIIGGLIAERVAAHADPRIMLLLLGGLHGLCVAGVRGIGSLQRLVPREPPAPVRSGMHVLAANRYLQQMAALMVLAAVVAGLLDYALKSETSLRYIDKTELLGFFATFYAAVGVATFVVQVSLAPLLLNRFGIGGTVFVLPGAVVFGSVAAAAFDQFWGYVCLRAAESVFANSLFRSGFEVLYTPLTPGEKRPTKTIIDVAGNRLGDVIGGGLLLALLFVLPMAPTELMVGLAAAVGIFALLLIATLYQGYVSRLAANLRGGWLALDASAVSDATTRRVFAETTAAAERELLLARIRELEGRHAEAASIAGDTRLQTLADLRSGQPERIRRALHGSDLDVTMAAHLVPLLADTRLAEEVRLELRWLAPRIVGQLTDALLDPDVPVLARRRIPSVLEVVHNGRVRDALLLGLIDADFGVRYSCARALARLTARSPDLKVVEEHVFDTVRRELAVDDETWRCQTHVASEWAARDGEDGEADDRVTPSLQHVFTVLSLALDREALPLAMQGVVSEDAAQRGTALEYLENVLPAEVREPMWQRLGVTEPVEKSQRSRKELITALLNFRRSGVAR